MVLIALRRTVSRRVVRPDSRNGVHDALLDVVELRGVDSDSAAPMAAIAGLTRTISSNRIYVN